MLTSIRIKNFKRLKDVTIDLGANVVFIGPNNSGKTTALQALALWEIGLKKWNEKWRGKTPERPGVTVNRRDLFSSPVPYANLLWFGTHVRRSASQNIRIEITVTGITSGKEWECGLEFEYANEESFYCRPLRYEVDGPPQRMPVPEEANDVKVVFLPPMSGLAADEPKWEQGRINYLLGQGQTAQVLRNLCLQIYENRPSDWGKLVQIIHQLFGVTIKPPKQTVTGAITMEYIENKVQLDLTSSGRGLQQMLLLFAYLLANPGTVLMLDEPDAHLEVLRQRQIYTLMTEVSEQSGSQIVAASHSEVVLNEAAQKDTLIAFVGKPHRIDDRGNQLLKSLKDIPFDHYFQAEQTGWILYLEGSTDLAILRQLAKTLDHPAADFLEKPLVHYIGNQLSKARDHFYGLREAKKDLVGLAIIDRTDISAIPHYPLREEMWKKREMENYLATEEVLLAYARHDDAKADLFVLAEAAHREQVMQQSIMEISDALQKLKKISPWSDDVKASDDFLTPLFDTYFEKLNLPNIMRKTDFHTLAKFLNKESIHHEVIDKLDAIAATAKQAAPLHEE